MKAKEFYNSVVDYVELTDGLISELQKKADDANAAPAFDEEALKKTAEVLVSADLLSRDQSEVLIDSWKKDPNRALDSLSKVASKLKAPEDRPSGMIGSPAGHRKEAAAKTPTSSERASDKAFLEDFGLNT